MDPGRIIDNIFKFLYACLLFPGAWYYGLAWFAPSNFTEFWDIECRKDKIERDFDSGRYSRVFGYAEFMESVFELEEMLKISILRLQRARFKWVVERALNRVRTIKKYIIYIKRTAKISAESETSRPANYRDLLRNSAILLLSMAIVILAIDVDREKTLEILLKILAHFWR